MPITEKIRALCKQKKTTLTALERELGFGGCTISRWGTSSPSADKLLKVAHYFSVSVDCLLDNKEAFESLTGEEIAMILRIRKLSPASQETVVAVVDNLEIVDGQINFKPEERV